MTYPEYCFTFVCQSGELEIESMLLASSLRLQMGDGIDLVACVPQPESVWGTLSATTLALLGELHVRQVPVRNGIAPSYPIGNKLGCLGVATAASRTIFLDSDIICLKALPQGAFPASFNAVPAFDVTWPSNANDWKPLYAAFNLPVPERRLLTPISGKYMWPYFNAGVIAVESNTEFSRVWEDCAQRIDAMDEVANKRPWLDQIALPIAAARLGLDFRCLGEDFNFPVSWSPLPPATPYLCHYRSPEVLCREPLLRKTVRMLADRHPGLAELLRTGPKHWARVIAPPRGLLPAATDAASPSEPGEQTGTTATPDRLPEIIITGIPRSGTSLLCRLVDDLPDCVVVNEPEEICTRLNRCVHPRWLATFYRDLRADIVDGVGVYNKVANGRLVEDTRIIDERVLCHPEVSRPDFLLGTKNTFIYLARLQVLRRAMPDAPIVALVRHPLDTIASWKDSFQHLAEVNLSTFPVSYTQNPFLTGTEKRRLGAIMHNQSPAQRRALLWSHLVATLLAHRDSLIIVRYEDVIADPAGVLWGLLSRVPDYTPPPLENIDLQPRSRRHLLNDDDVQAVSDLCRSYAAEFGYKDF
ncbi:sulfotransferase family protein [Methylolobus aquaticus]